MEMQISRKMFWVCSIILNLFRYQSNTSKDVLDTILSIQPKDSAAGGGETRESIVRKQANDMLSKLPADYLPHEVSLKLDGIKLECA